MATTKPILASRFQISRHVSELPNPCLQNNPVSSLQAAVIEGFERTAQYFAKAGNTTSFPYAPGSRHETSTNYASHSPYHHEI